MEEAQGYRALAVRLALRAAGLRPERNDEVEKVLEMFDSPVRASATDPKDLWSVENLRSGLRKKGIIR